MLVVDDGVGRSVVLVVEAVTGGRAAEWVAGGDPAHDDRTHALSSAPAGTRNRRAPTVGSRPEVGDG
jgi:hypothetical protein